MSRLAPIVVKCWRNKPRAIHRCRFAYLGIFADSDSDGRAVELGMGVAFGEGRCSRCVRRFWDRLRDGKQHLFVCPYVVAYTLGPQHAVEVPCKKREREAHI